MENFDPLYGACLTRGIFRRGPEHGNKAEGSM